METTTTKILPGPKTFTKKDVLLWLSELGVIGVTTTAGLSSALGTCSQRIIREKIKQGDLKPIDPTAKQFVFTTDAIADFIIKNPVYACRKATPRHEITQERFNELASHIKNIANRHFRWMLNFTTMDDIVADVFARIVKSRSEWNAPDSVVLFRFLNKVARKYLLKHPEIPTDPSELENIPDENEN